jgi:hypothetical protein
MISIFSEEELLATFRTIDRGEVSLPSEISYPLVLKDYIAWLEPSGHRVFLVFQEPDGSCARGVVFKRATGTAEPVVQMCQWCHSVRGGGAVRLLTAKASPKRVVGLLLCNDLSCKDKVLNNPGVNDLREPFGAYEKLFRVIMNMRDFVRSLSPEMAAQPGSQKATKQSPLETSSQFSEKDLAESRKLH